MWDLASLARENRSGHFSANAGRETKNWDGQRWKRCGRRAQLENVFLVRRSLIANLWLTDHTHSIVPPEIP